MRIPFFFGMGEGRVVWRELPKNPEGSAGNAASPEKLDPSNRIKKINERMDALFQKFQKNQNKGKEWTDAWKQFREQYEKIRSELGGVEQSKVALFDGLERLLHTYEEKYPDPEAKKPFPLIDIQVANEANKIPFPLFGVSENVTPKQETTPESETQLSEEDATELERLKLKAEALERNEDGKHAWYETINTFAEYLRTQHGVEIPEAVLSRCQYKGSEYRLVEKKEGKNTVIMEEKFMQNAPSRFFAFNGTTILDEGTYRDEDTKDFVSGTDRVLLKHSEKVGGHSVRPALEKIAKTIPDKNYWYYHNRFTQEAVDLTRPYAAYHEWAKEYHASPQKEDALLKLGGILEHEKDLTSFQEYVQATGLPANLAQKAKEQLQVVQQFSRTIQEKTGVEIQLVAMGPFLSLGLKQSTYLHLHAEPGGKKFVVDWEKTSESYITEKPKDPLEAVKMFLHLDVLQKAILESSILDRRDDVKEFADDPGFLRCAALGISEDLFVRRLVDPGIDRAKATALYAQLRERMLKQNKNALQKNTEMIAARPWQSYAETGKSMGKQLPPSLNKANARYRIVSNTGKHIVEFISLNERGNIEEGYVDIDSGKNMLYRRDRKTDNSELARVIFTKEEQTYLASVPETQRNYAYFSDARINALEVRAERFSEIHEGMKKTKAIVEGGNITWKNDPSKHHFIEYIAHHTVDYPTYADFMKTIGVKPEQSVPLFRNAVTYAANIKNCVTKTKEELQRVFPSEEFTVFPCVYGNGDSSLIVSTRMVSKFLTVKIRHGGEGTCVMQEEKGTAPIAAIYKKFEGASADQAGRLFCEIMVLSGLEALIVKYRLWQSAYEADGKTPIWKGKQAHKMLSDAGRAIDQSKTSVDEAGEDRKAWDRFVTYLRDNSEVETDTSSHTAGSATAQELYGSADERAVPLENLANNISTGLQELGAQAGVSMARTNEPVIYIKRTGVINARIPLIRRENRIVFGAPPPEYMAANKKNIENGYDPLPLMKYFHQDPKKQIEATPARLAEAAKEELSPRGPTKEFIENAQKYLGISTFDLFDVLKTAMGTDFTVESQVEGIMDIAEWSQVREIQRELGTDFSFFRKAEDMNRLLSVLYLSKIPNVARVISVLRNANIPLGFSFEAPRTTIDLLKDRSSLMIVTERVSKRVASGETKSFETCVMEEWAALKKLQEESFVSEELDVEKNPKVIDVLVIAEGEDRIVRNYVQDYQRLGGAINRDNESGEKVTIHDALFVEDKKDLAKKISVFKEKNAASYGPNGKRHLAVFFIAHGKADGTGSEDLGNADDLAKQMEFDGKAPSIFYASCFGGKHLRNVARRNPSALKNVFSGVSETPDPLKASEEMSKKIQEGYLEGADGRKAADLNGDGRVTLGELRYWLDTETLFHDAVGYDEKGNQITALESKNNEFLS